MFQTFLFDVIKTLQRDFARVETRSTFTNPRRECFDLTQQFCANQPAATGKFGGPVVKTSFFQPQVAGSTPDDVTSIFIYDLGIHVGALG